MQLFQSVHTHIHGGLQAVLVKVKFRVVNGACMGCSCKTKYGNKRICKEGPVLTKGEVIW